MSIALDKAAIVDELKDRREHDQNVSAEFLNRVKQLPKETVNAVILESLDDDFWQAYDEARSKAIAALRTFRTGTVDPETLNQPVLFTDPQEPTQP